MSLRILVLDEDFAEYQQLLAEAGVAVDAAADPTTFTGSYDVLLAQPDLASDYLEQGGVVPWIQSTWAGIDRLVPAAKARNLLVTGVKDIFGPQMAEYVFAFLLQQSRSLDYFRETQACHQWSPRRPQSLAGQTMTILGTGTIGSHIAEVARAFGMETRGVSRSARPVAAFDHVYPMMEVMAAASGTQVLINTLPSTALTREVLSAPLLEVLASNATLFNLGRGDALCEASLKAWLDSRPRSRAVLDVFRNEPLSADHWLWGHPRVRVTPHVAAVSFPEDVVTIFLDNLAHWRKGEPLRYVVDLQRGY